MVISTHYMVSDGYIVSTIVYCVLDKDYMKQTIRLAMMVNNYSIPHRLLANDQSHHLISVYESGVDHMASIIVFLGENNHQAHQYSDLLPKIYRNPKLFNQQVTTSSIHDIDHGYQC